VWNEADHYLPSHCWLRRFQHFSEKYSNWDTTITRKISKLQFPSCYTCETKSSTIYVVGKFVKPNSIEERLKGENAKTFTSPQLWKEAWHKLQTAEKAVNPGLDQQLI